MLVGFRTDRTLPPRTEKMINILIVYTINTGLFTTWGSLAFIHVPLQLKHNFQLHCYWFYDRCKAPSLVVIRGTDWLHIVSNFSSHSHRRTFQRLCLEGYLLPPLCTWHTSNLHPYSLRQYFPCHVSDLPWHCIFETQGLVLVLTAENPSEGWAMIAKPPLLPRQFLFWFMDPMFPIALETQTRENWSSRGWWGLRRDRIQWAWGHCLICRFSKRTYVWI